MTIAIDIDNTWSRDPDLFFDFAWLAKNKGHTVIIVTGREQPQDKLDRLYLSRAPISEILVSGGELKEEFCLKRGIKVDIWIEDMPGMVQRCPILDGDLNVKDQ